MKKLGLLLMSIIAMGFMSCTSDESIESSTGSIYGVVTVKETAEPMRATGVELYYDGSLLLKTVTYDDGHYEFENLMEGEYVLNVVASGYEDATYSVFVEAGRTARADMQLVRLNTHMTVTTLSATDIGGNKATLNGKYTYENYVNYHYAPSEIGFMYASTPLPSNGGTSITCPITGTFNYVLSNLKKGKYYYQAYAKNNIGTEYGDVQTFEIDGKPLVSTLEATNITETTATLNGVIEYEGDPAYTERGFVYSSSYPNPTIDDPATATTKVVVSGNSKEFSANIADLIDLTTYHVRAYVTNSSGTVYGDVVDFTHGGDYIELVEDGIMVQMYDISSGATWNDANDLCKSSRVGGFSDWRLPTIGESKAIYKNINSLNIDTSIYYWTSEKDAGTSYYAFDYKYNSSYSRSYSSSYRVRCVRTIKK